MIKCDHNQSSSSSSSSSLFVVCKRFLQQNYSRHIFFFERERERKSSIDFACTFLNRLNENNDFQLKYKINIQETSCVEIEREKKRLYDFNYSIIGKMNSSALLLILLFHYTLQFIPPICMFCSLFTQFSIIFFSPITAFFFFCVEN